MKQWIPSHTIRAAKALDALLQPEHRLDHQVQPLVITKAEPKQKRSFFARLAAIFTKD